jgi:hypothetical protein
LGIQDAYWPTDPQGIDLGAGNIRLYPADMAKIGFLFLHDGVWDGKQVVSSAWVEEAIKKHYSLPNGDGYGYGWWSSVNDTRFAYFAAGDGGQRIDFNPGFNSVVVTPYILAAFLDPKNPLPANPAGVAELEQVLKTLPQQPASQPIPELPDIAVSISGKTFQMDENPFGVASVRLDFNNGPLASFQVTFKDGTQSPLAAVGLDGVYRLTPGLNLDRAFHSFVNFADLSVGLRGNWLDNQTFILEYDTIVNYYYYRLQMHFKGDQLSLALSERTGDPMATLTGRLENP